MGFIPIKFSIFSLIHPLDFERTNERNHKMKDGSSRWRKGKIHEG